MSLSAFTFVALGVFLIILAFGGIIEWLNQRRISDGKRLRDLYAENCKLRAQLKHRDFDHEWEIDSIRTELAVKDLLLRQRWASAKK